MYLAIRTMKLRLAKLGTKTPLILRNQFTLEAGLGHHHLVVLVAVRANVHTLFAAGNVRVVLAEVVQP